MLVLVTLFILLELFQRRRELGYQPLNLPQGSHPHTPVMAAQLTDHIWLVEELLLFVSNLPLNQRESNYPASVVAVPLTTELDWLKKGRFRPWPTLSARRCST